MKLNLLTIFYISFRLAPFIIVSYLSLSSFFGQDYRAIIYLAGLLIACFVTVLADRTIPLRVTKYDDSPDVPDVCNSLTLTDTGPLSRIPLSQTILCFTYFYLFYAINNSPNSVKVNLPTIIIFPIIIVADFIWNYVNMCSTFLGVSIASIFGLGFGYLWGYIVEKMVGGDINNKLRYFNGVSGQQICSRPQKQIFKCSGINTIGQMDGSNDKKNNVDDIMVLKSTKLYPNTFDFYTADTSKELQIPNSGIYIITVDSNTKEPNSIYSFMILGIKGNSPSQTHISNILLNVNANQPWDTATPKSNGFFSLRTKNSGFTNSNIYFYELYSNKVKTLLDGPKNINTASGGNLQSFTLPSSGLFFITIDGNDSPFSDTENIYSFYIVACQGDAKNKSFISSLNKINYGSSSKGFTVTGDMNGKFNAVVNDGNKSMTNYNVYYNQLFGNTVNMKLLNSEIMPVNINNFAGGSQHTFTLPSSGVYIITVDSGNQKNVNSILSFYICGYLESNELCIVTEIANPEGKYGIEMLRNAQFSLNYFKQGDGSTKNFNVYYFKIYP
jgi:hypothetical protein